MLSEKYVKLEQNKSAFYRLQPGRVLWNKVENVLEHVGKSGRSRPSQETKKEKALP